MELPKSAKSLNEQSELRLLRDTNTLPQKLLTSCGSAGPKNIDNLNIQKSESPCLSRLLIVLAEITAYPKTPDMAAAGATAIFTGVGTFGCIGG